MRIRCKIVVDSGIESKDFADLVMIYLNDPNGWVKKGYTFTQVSSKEDVLIHLSTPQTVKKQCGISGLSCAEMGGKQMYLNSKRWFEGAPKSKLNLVNYRQYLVSHEMGHILGYDHETCKGPGHPAPIMMQQTKGIRQCFPNTAVQ